MTMLPPPHLQERQQDDEDIKKENETEEQSFHLYKKPTNLTQHRCEKIVKYAQKRLGGVRGDGVCDEEGDVANISNSNNRISSMPSTPIVSHSQIEIGERLGKGAFSSVYEIKSIRNKNNKSTEEDNAVVKFLRPKLYYNHGLFAASAADLVKEGNILSTLCHKNVIKLHAVSSASGVNSYLLNGCYHDSYFLVLERLANTLMDRMNSEWKPRHMELYKDDDHDDDGHQALTEICTDATSLPSTASNNFNNNKTWKNRTMEQLTKLRKSSSRFIVRQQQQHALLPSSSSAALPRSSSKSSLIVPPPAATEAGARSSSSSHSSSSEFFSSEESSERSLQDDCISAATIARVDLLDERIDVALQLAAALKYLHEQNVIHRDLKPDNIGFDARSGTLKVFDFDIARVVPTTEARNQNKDDDALYHMTHTVGSPRYMSPECAKSEPYNLKADVYSYGLLFHQILTLEKPYDDITDDEHNDLVFSEGIRPHISDLGLPKVVEEMLNNSFSPRIQDRPTMHIICDTLIEERPNIVRIGTTTDSTSSLATAATSYVSSCTFESFSDHNPAIKKKMKMMRVNKMNKNNNWNITPFKSGKNNSNMSSSNNKVRFSPFRRPVRLAKAA